MCLNCGCGVYDDEMGNADNLTISDIAKAAIASNMSAKDTIEETIKALQNIKPEDVEAEIQKLKDEQKNG